jgi:hypothetical protein
MSARREFDDTPIDVQERRRFQECVGRVGFEDDRNAKIKALTLPLSAPEVVMMNTMLFFRFSSFHAPRFGVSFRRLLGDRD